MPNAADALNIVQEVEQLANEVLETVEALDPAAALPVAAIEMIERLATAALSAWTQASGTPITVESVQALMPNPTPLTDPVD